MSKDPIVLSSKKREIYLQIPSNADHIIDCSNTIGAKLNLQILPDAVLRLNMQNANEDTEINIICGTALIKADSTITQRNIRLHNEEATCRLNGQYITETISLLYQDDSLNMAISPYEYKTIGDKIAENS